jgi:hypothetical protein
MVRTPLAPHMPAVGNLLRHFCKWRNHNIVARSGEYTPSRGCDAVVAYLLPKQTVVGSNPITRSKWKQPLGQSSGRLCFLE